MGSGENHSPGPHSFGNRRALPHPRGIPGLKRTNVPQNIVYVARALAHYMGVSEEDVIRHAKVNTERIFGV